MSRRDDPERMVGFREHHPEWDDIPDDWVRKTRDWAEWQLAWAWNDAKAEVRRAMEENSFVRWVVQKWLM